MEKQETLYFFLHYLAISKQMETCSGKNKCASLMGLFKQTELQWRKQHITVRIVVLHCATGKENSPCWLVLAGVFQTSQTALLSALSALPPPCHCTSSFRHPSPDNGPETWTTRIRPTRLARLVLADDLGAKSASRRQRQKSFPTGELHLTFCKRCQ